MSFVYYSMPSGFFFFIPKTFPPASTNEVYRPSIILFDETVDTTALWGSTIHGNVKKRKENEDNHQSSHVF